MTTSAVFFITIDRKFALDPESTPKSARKAPEKLGLTATGRHVGYASHANQLADTGIEILVGLGPYGGGMHTGQEFLSVPAYEERLQLGIALIRRLANAH